MTRVATEETRTAPPLHRSKLYRSIVPPFHRSTVPPFHRSTVPPFHRSTAPTRPAAPHTTAPPREPPRPSASDSCPLDPEKSALPPRATSAPARGSHRG